MKSALYDADFFVSSQLEFIGCIFLFLDVLSIGSGFSPILIKEVTLALAKTYYKIFDFCF